MPDCKLHEEGQGRLQRQGHCQPPSHAAEGPAVSQEESSGGRNPTRKTQGRQEETAQDFRRDENEEGGKERP